MPRPGVGAVARWLGPHGRRKWRLLRRRPCAFARMYKRDVLHKISPLPNPPWYQESPSLWPDDPLKRFHEANRLYVDTWRRQFRGEYDDTPGHQASGADGGSGDGAGVGQALRNAADSVASSLKSDAEGHVRVGQTEVQKPQSVADAVSSVRQLGESAVAAGRSVAPAAKSFAAERVDIAKEALQEFVRGFRAGKREQILESLEESAQRARETAHLAGSAGGAGASVSS